jgi:hypothetical protein
MKETGNSAKVWFDPFSSFARFMVQSSFVGLGSDVSAMGTSPHRQKSVADTMFVA